MHYSSKDIYNQNFYQKDFVHQTVTNGWEECFERDAYQKGNGNTKKASHRIDPNVFS